MVAIAIFLKKWPFYRYFMMFYTTQQNHYNHIFGWVRAVSHAKFSDKNNYDDQKGLRSVNLRLHVASTWRYFRFIDIGGF